MTMVGHASCARTLHAIDIVVRDPTIVRAYWAQGVGSKADDGKYRHIYAYDPFVVYDQDRKQYRYKASYYAFWMYGRMAGTRLDVAQTDPKLGVWACRDGKATRVVMWNKAPQPRAATLAIAGVPDAAKCTMYRVDPATFKLEAGGLEAVISGPQSKLPFADPAIKTVAQAAAWLRANQLGGEAAVMLDIS